MGAPPRPLLSLPWHPLPRARYSTRHRILQQPTTNGRYQPTSAMFMSLSQRMPSLHEVSSTLELQDSLITHRITSWGKSHERKLAIAHTVSIVASKDRSWRELRLHPYRRAPGTATAMPVMVGQHHQEQLIM
jgi:hypothetical protein